MSRIHRVSSTSGIPFEKTLPDDVINRFRDFGLKLLNVQRNIHLELETVKEGLFLKSDESGLQLSGGTRYLQQKIGDLFSLKY